MAEVALEALIQQVSRVLVEEARLLSWVREDIRQLQNELVMMKAFLRHADRKRSDDLAVNAWVEQVRQLAYYVGNSLDDMLLLLREPWPHMGFIDKCRWYTLHYLLVDKLRISCRIRVINRRIQNISQLKGKFALESSSQTVNATSKAADELRLRAPLFVEDSQLVGIGGPKKKLVRMLLDGVHEERRVISVVGMGGLGKTTLARRVMKEEEVESHFERRQAWIAVSQSYSSAELFIEMIRSFFGTERRDLVDLSAIQLVERLRSGLQGLRYMIVLDDVWEKSDWDDLRQALPENNQHSRVIVTTRKLDVAQHCSQQGSLVYELEPLSGENSRSLLFKTVFKSPICPPELEELSIEILKSCGGLPLAIVLIGGLLLSRGRTRAEWDVVKRSLVSELVNGEELGSLSRILWLSYEDLPVHLKPCYLYFGMFPEDYLVNRGMLTRQLVGEGFIAPIAGDGSVSLEEIADGYIHQLVSRNLIQVEKKDAYGRVKFCKIHDLLHDLLVSQCREQNFVLIAGRRDQGGTNHIEGSIYRLSVGKERQVPDDSTISLKQVRSFFMYPANISAYPKLSRFKMLRVLNLQDAPLDAFPRCILRLCHLRYLNIRGTKINELPNSISSLRNLQTLDLKRTDMPQLPNGIVHCLSLRNILVYGPGGRHVLGATMPVQLGNLVCLQKLCFLKLNGVEQVKELGKLTQLRNLAISDLTGEQMTALAASESNMNQLQSLQVTLTDRYEAVDLLSLLTPPLLRRLTFFGHLHSLSRLDAQSFTFLTKIGLGNSSLKEDPFLVLQYLPTLTDLRFQNAYTGVQLRCGPHGFQKLVYLAISELYYLYSLIIDEGGMPLLEIMQIHYCSRLVTAPHGIQHLQSLKQLRLSQVPDLINRVRTVELHKVEHILMRSYR